ncbi:FAD binding domain-containing protein [Colletotrichum sublineola]|uniref:Putative FAD binding domain-containing protein n=1 Tax=Colletotrichum sublineola TaxID=1173701 RepID=A0A066X986_COLSU|nr:FAD binding domain-containing protein [Colletotrichum sublineola]KDN65688.1 putative FAD binding domain-containing protein [Colletotrichum sublineola]
MSKSLPSCTWKNGYRAPAEHEPIWSQQQYFTGPKGELSHYGIQPENDEVTSTAENSYGRSRLRTWPALYNGTLAPGGPPSWWDPAQEVDVIICGAGPFGLEMAMNLARQGISFRIVDKAERPCLSGRADGLQPRGLEYLESWGVGTEGAEEGPILNSTVLYRNGEKLLHGWSRQCDSRYKGVHVITQGQVEKIYIRDLLRHRAVVERGATVESFKVQEGQGSDYPVSAIIKNLKSGKTENVRAKYLIGADGASSKIRETLGIPFDGLATSCFWAIMECEFKTDYPHILGFNYLSHSEYGGCIVIPREQGQTRFYVQITGAMAEKVEAARKASRRSDDSAVGETQIHDHGITPDEVLEHLNKIMAPWQVEFASAMSWFALWRVNERVARTYSSQDGRVWIGGDAAHVHSTMGAFGLNSSIYDAANLGWKLGLSIRGHARPDVLLPTYDCERRLYANRVIRTSGANLRFICNLKLPLAQLRGLGDELDAHDEALPELDGTVEADRRFVSYFFRRNAFFLMGVEGPTVVSAICPEMGKGPSAPEPAAPSSSHPTTVANGVRAPSPRVCLETNRTGYLYDRMRGVGRFHILVFASDLRGPARERLAHLCQFGLGDGPSGFWARFGGSDRFNLLLITKALPHESRQLLLGGGGHVVTGNTARPGLTRLADLATMVYDDRAPDEDAHYTYGINHARGAVIVVRPDLMIGMSAWPEESECIKGYFAGFLNEVNAR